MNEVKGDIALWGAIICVNLWAAVGATPFFSVIALIVWLILLTAIAITKLTEKKDVPGTDK